MSNHTQRQFAMNTGEKPKPGCISLCFSLFFQLPGISKLDVCCLFSDNPGRGAICRKNVASLMPHLEGQVPLVDLSREIYHTRIWEGINQTNVNYAKQTNHRTGPGRFDSTAFWHQSNTPEPRHRLCPNQVRPQSSPSTNNNTD